MARKRVYTKGRRESGQFLQLPMRVTRSEQFTSLKPRAVKLLIDVAIQYNGRNNGDLLCTWEYAKTRGWRSKQTLYAALSDLEQARFLLKSRQGGLHIPNLFAVSFFPVDDVGEKLELLKPTKVPPHSWEKQH